MGLQLPHPEFSVTMSVVHSYLVRVHYFQYSQCPDVSITGVRRIRAWTFQVWEFCGYAIIIFEAYTYRQHNYFSRGHNNHDLFLDTDTEIGRSSGNWDTERWKNSRRKFVFVLASQGEVKCRKARVSRAKYLYKNQTVVSVYRSVHLEWTTHNEKNHSVRRL